jgi:hypothetical protein
VEGKVSIPFNLLGLVSAQMVSSDCADSSAGELEYRTLQLLKFNALCGDDWLPVHWGRNWSGTKSWNNSKSAELKDCGTPPNVAIFLNLKTAIIAAESAKENVNWYYCEDCQLRILQLSTAFGGTIVPK